MLMAISFLRPYFLLLLPFAIGVILFGAKKLSKMQRARRRLIVVLRNIIVIFLVLALSAPNILWTANTTLTVFLVDASDSTLASRTKIEEFIRNSMQYKPAKDKVGVVAFGDNALIENFIAKNSAFSKIETKPNGTYTNIENSITAALALMPDSSKKRIVLITDGEENEGKASKLVPSLLEQGVDLKVYKIDKVVGNEVAIDSVSVPQKLNVGEEFGVVINITSTVNTSAKISLLSGKEKTAEERVQINKGSNKFVFKDTAKEGGFKSYKVVIEPDADTELKNNEASAFTNIKDKPRILVIEDAKGEAEELIKMLKASGMDYNKIEAAAAPRNLEELTAYKSIITCNVSAENLNEGFLNALDSYVKDFGGGFIATGGENSFALGGYFKTTLEKVLPVNMDMKGKKEIPEMAMLLIIDKSGSMMDGSGGITKLDIAKEAAVRTLESLRPKDQIGVLTFDDTLYWVVKMKKAEDRDKIKDDIGTIRPGGGTSILPALDEGYEALKKSSAKIKHIILLTDGQAERDGYNDLIDKIKKDNITVSTVAVGGDADKVLLENLAKNASGRFYSTSDISSIPKIFAKETFMAAKAYLNNREFTPVIAGNHSIISGVAEGGLPPLLGYIGASPKDSAKVILKSDEDDPILTVWQYGLGKTAAWNSDINGKWSANYVGWDKNMKLWQNMINYTVENYESENAAIEVNTEGSKGVINFTDKNSKEEVDTRAVVVTPSLQNMEIKLYPTAPGKYSGGFDIKEPGVYMVKGRQLKGEETLNAVTTGLALQYSPEYRIASEKSSLDNLVKEAGGSYISSASEAFKGSPKHIPGKIDLTPYLLALALILFVLDIALRRLNIPLHKLQRFMERISDKLTSLRRYKKKNAKIKIDKKQLRSEVQENLKANSEKVEKNKELKPKIKISEEKPDEEKEESILDTSALLKKKQKRNK